VYNNNKIKEYRPKKNVKHAEIGSRENGLRRDVRFPPRYEYIVLRKSISIILILGESNIAEQFNIIIYFVDYDVWYEPNVGVVVIKVVGQYLHYESILKPIIMKKIPVFYNEEQKKSQVSAWEDERMLQYE
jgi:hypothetical protein